jgi:hypothetical protein
MSGKIGQKDEKTSTGCRKGAGFLFLCLRATWGKNELDIPNSPTFFPKRF